MPTSSSPPLLTTRYGIAAKVSGNDAVARSLRVYGEWAEHETDLLSGLIEEGHSVLELGGDYAAHTLWIARAVGTQGRVHVVEPRRMRFQQLCANVALNGLDNVFAHPIWLGRAQGEIALTTDSDPEQVRMSTLDGLSLGALHLIKINMTHALVDALAGGSETIRMHRPLIYARLSGMERAADEVAAIKSLGYRVWSHLPYLFNADNHAGTTENIFPGIVQQNVVAAPADGRFEFTGRLEL